MGIVKPETDPISIETLQSVHPVFIEVEPNFFKQRIAVQNARMRENIEFIVENRLNVALYML